MMDTTERLSEADRVCVWHDMRAHQAWHGVIARERACQHGATNGNKSLFQPSFTRRRREWRRRLEERVKRPWHRHRAASSHPVLRVLSSRRLQPSSRRSFLLHFSWLFVRSPVQLAHIIVNQPLHAPGGSAGPIPVATCYIPGRVQQHLQASLPLGLVPAARLLWSKDHGGQAGTVNNALPGIAVYRCVSTVYPRYYYTLPLHLIIHTLLTGNRLCSASCGSA